MQHQQFWTPAAGGQAHTLELEWRSNVPPRQWIHTSHTFVPCSCLAAKLGIPDNSSAVERQELLRRQYILDPTLWWDCRRDKKSARSPDFRHKESKEPLWLNNLYKPDRVDARRNVLESWIGRSAQPTSNPSLHHSAGAPTAPECQGYATAQAVNELCANGQLDRAVVALSDLADRQCGVSTSLLYRVIRRCGAEKNLVLGRRLDDLTVKLGYGSNAFLGNHILRMYACQGRLHEAMKVFKRVATPSVYMWSSIISAQTEHGNPSVAIQLYNEMRSSGLEPDNHIFVAALQACARAVDVESGRQVHSDVLESSIQPNSFVHNCMVDMYTKCGELDDARKVFDSMATRNVVASTAMISGYAKCGKLEDARKVFDSLSTRDAVTWNAMIDGYAEHGLGQQALMLYARMEQEGLLADSVTYTCLLKACASAGALQQGRKLHSQIVERGLLERDVVLGNCLVNMYAKCGQLEEAHKVFDSMATRDVVASTAMISGYAKCGKLDDARKVFDRMSTKNVVTWTAMINGYVERGLGPQALLLYARMEHEGPILEDSVTYACLLKACASAGALQQGRKLHAQIMESGLLEVDIVLGNCLINMYAKCGQLDDARKVFDSLTTRDAVTWTAMINGYAENGLGPQALLLYARMEQDGPISADSVTYACLLKACASAGALQQGRQLHSTIVKRGLFDGDVVMGNCLVNMYAKCGQLEDARMVFDSLSTRDAITWIVMINAYAEDGLSQEALILYARMEQEGLISPDSVTYACLLKACASAGALRQGRQLHSQILEHGLLEGNVVLGNCLINMYAKCGQLETAREVFDSLATRDAVTWTAMLNGYADYGLGQQALILYARMEDEGLILANTVTYACLLKACASATALQQGRLLHSQIVERGLLAGDLVLGNCLINMYAKCGQLDDARKVFDSLTTRDAVTWTAMINGYAVNGLGPQALLLYARMEQDGPISADSVTYACLLKACASAGALQQGRQLHSQIVEQGLFEGNVVLGNCLVDMYAKCGQLKDAREVFDSLPTRDAVSWNAIINGYGRNNEGHKAIACFEDMMLAGSQPNDATFVCLLVACSHEGLVSKGRQYFDAMVTQHGLNPTIEHHNCMVDLLGRAGHIDEAEKMLFSVGCTNNAVGLTSLLNACKSHGDIVRGTRCFESLIELDPQHASAYVLMANMYADADMWADVDRIERLRKLAGASKKPAVAGIEVNKQVHRFVVGEERGDISCKVESTSVRLKEEGKHVPHTKLVLKPLSEKEKEDELCGHAEKLALAYGLLNTPDGTPLLVTKNLRMCSDCHSSTEIMSRVEKRDIVVRDGYRVHRFEEGSCSCRGRH